MALAIGMAVPSMNNARSAETTAPIKFWANPKKEDAVPVMAEKGVSAFAVDKG